MAKKTKKSKWQRNYENVVRAQNRAKSLIAELSNQGIEVSEYLKDFVNRPLKSTRYTEKQARNYIALTRSNVIRADAKRFAKMEAKRQAKNPRNYYIADSYVGHLNITNRPRYHEKIEYRTGHEHEDIAKAYFEHLKYAITEKPDYQLAKNLQDTMRLLGVKSKNKMRISSMNMFMEGVDEEDFIKAYVKAMESGDSDLVNDLETLRGNFYKKGKSSKAAYDAAKEIQFEQAKQTFGENIKYKNWDREDVDKLYNFFKNSQTWRVFQANYKDSDQFEELFDEISDTSLSIQQIDDIIMTYNNIDRILKELRGAK